MEIAQNISLRQLNTFGVPAVARYFARYLSPDECYEIRDFVDKHKLPLLILGGGSNVLFKGNFEGLVVLVSSPGFRAEVLGETASVTFAAGERWDDAVRFCTENGFAGIENLSLIPGSCGAAPVQNIGAYGVELSDVLQSLKAFDLLEGCFRDFTQPECFFGYRDSIFKQSPGRFLITEITCQLSIKFSANLSYAALQREVDAEHLKHVNLSDMRRIVCKIRVEKLPDPSTIGNAGSFFKNPVVLKDFHDRLKKRFPDLTSFPAEAGKMKLAAGWLIDFCGFKGITKGRVGTWKNQALVLVNRGGATGEEILNFSQDIISVVYDTFEVLLEREVNIVGRF